MRRGTYAALAVAATLLCAAGPAAAASKNVQLLDTLPEAKNATAINFLQYKKAPKAKGEPKQRGPFDVMLVTGRFGLKTYCARRPGPPEAARRDHSRGTATAGRPAVEYPPSNPDVDVLAERGHGRRREAQARAAVARPARVRGLDESRTGRTRPERRDEHRRRLRRRRQGAGRPEAAHVQAAADGPHDHLHQRLQWLWTGGPASTDPPGAGARLGVRAADHRHRPARPAQPGRLPDAAGRPVPPGRRHRLLARRRRRRRGHRLGRRPRRHARLLDRGPPLRPAAGARSAGRRRSTRSRTRAAGCRAREVGSSDRTQPAASMHNSWRPIGYDAPATDPRYRKGELLLGTEEDFGPARERVPRPRASSRSRR